MKKGVRSWRAALENARRNPDVFISEDKDDGRRNNSSVSPVIDGVRFDSRSEAARYLILRERMLQGMIRNLRVHPQYTLKPEMTTESGVSRVVRWRADFEYEQNGLLIVEDWKGGGHKFRNFKEKLPWILAYFASFPNVRVFINDDLSGWYKEVENGARLQDAGGDQSPLSGEISK